MHLKREAPRMRRRRLPTSSMILDDLGETSGPRIDRIPPTRPSWRDRQYRELKKLFFSPPSKCPIDLFGPVSNRTILKRLHGASRSSSRNPRLPGADGSWGPQPETSGARFREPETGNLPQLGGGNLQPATHVPPLSVSGGHQEH